MGICAFVASWECWRERCENECFLCIMGVLERKVWGHVLSLHYGSVGKKGMRMSVFVASWECWRESCGNKRFRCIMGVLERKVWEQVLSLPFRTGNGVLFTEILILL